MTNNTDLNGIYLAEEIVFSPKDDVIKKGDNKNGKEKKKKGKVNGKNKTHKRSR